MRNEDGVFLGAMISAFGAGMTAAAAFISIFGFKENAPAREDGVCPAAASAGNLEARVCAWHDGLRPVACVRVEDGVVAVLKRPPARADLGDRERDGADVRDDDGGDVPEARAAVPPDGRGGDVAPLLPKDGAGGEVGRGAGAKPGEGRSERKD